MKYFGTDGFRGEANIGLTAQHAYRIGRFLGYYYRHEGEERPRVVIGKDTRRSSYMLEFALAAGLTSSGADAYLLHVTTTPSVSYIVRADEFHCGIMISASHNPFYDNGIKLISGDGAKMSEDVLEQIEAYLDRDADDLPFAHREALGETKDYVFGRNRYTGYLISTVRRSFKGMRVGLDCANGASFTIARSVFEALGAETVVIHDRPNGLNINVDSGSTHIEHLVRLVREEKLDAGFAFDGDADRCIAVDEKGNVMDGDAILYICSQFLRENRELANDTVVTTVMSNFGLYKALDQVGIRYVKTSVGDKFVTKEMLQNGYMLGGEQSGHIVFGKYATTGDGILTAIRMMEVMVERKLPFSALHKDLIIYPQILKNVLVKDKHAVLSNSAVNACINAVNAELGEDGRTLVRPSGTEPVLRVMAEAINEAQCEAVVDRIIAAINDAGLLVEIK